MSITTASTFMLSKSYEGTSMFYDVEAKEKETGKVIDPSFGQWIVAYSDDEAIEEAKRWLECEGLDPDDYEDFKIVDVSEEG